MYDFKNVLQRQLISSSDLFYVLSGYQDFYHLAFVYSRYQMMNELRLNSRHNVYRGLLKQNRICRVSETLQLSVEEIHRHAHQFVDGTRN